MRPSTLATVGHDNKFPGSCIGNNTTELLAQPHSQPSSLPLSIEHSLSLFGLQPVQLPPAFVCDAESCLPPIILHVVFRGRISLLNPELTDSTASLLVEPCLLSTRTADRASHTCTYMGAGNPGFGPHSCAARLSHRSPPLALLLFNVLMQSVCLGCTWTFRHTVLVLPFI